MHKYYQKNYAKLKKSMNGYLKLISGELQQASGKDYSELLEEIWDFYDKNLLEHFPYIGGDDAPLYREQTCASGGEYCDFKLKSGAPVLPYWPPVFKQGDGYQ